MTTLASRTRLPPSPELNALTGNAAATPTGDPQPLFALAAHTSSSSSPPQQQVPRLRSVARYASYRPQTLATSNLLPSLHTSLGAVAGSHGVAIFRVSEPQTPLALLHHSTAAPVGATAVGNRHGIGTTTTTRASSRCDNLCFQPDSHSCLLAGSRGSAVLIWDGALAPSALTDRCEAPAGETLSSLTWRSSHVLVASTPSTACLWDVRQANRSKPTLRFGSTATANEAGGSGAGGLSNGHHPYVQIATNESHQVALMDAGGFLRVWDWRYLEGGGAGAGASFNSKVVETIEAFHSVGVGLAALSSASSTLSSWVVWGYEQVNEGAVAKVLAPKSLLTGATTIASEDLTQASTDDILVGDSPYVELGLLQTPDLACVRVQDEHVVTLGVRPKTWQADVWKVNATSVDPVVSFQSSRNFGTVCAADLALSTFSRMIEEGSPGNFAERTSGLLLVNLTEDGYVTTHVSLYVDLQFCLFRVKYGRQTNRCSFSVWLLATDLTHPLPSTFIRCTVNPRGNGIAPCSNHPGFQRRNSD